MSAKSSNKHHKSPRHRLSDVASRVVGQRPESGWKWAMIVLLPLWVFTAFMASSFAVAAIMIVLDWLHLSPESYLRPTIVQTVLAMVVYALTIGIVIGVPYALKRRTVSLQTLGLARLPSWTDIGLAPVVYVVYVIVIASVLAAITAWFNGFPLDEVQDVGFNAFGSRTDNILAFLTLVVLAPIAEETLFRGYLYGKLKVYVPAVLAAVATSLLFALVHFQLNVGIDVFILSLFLCGLRSLTGSIWAGVLVHMIKNGVAYYILFVSPLIGG